MRGVVGCSGVAGVRPASLFSQCVEEPGSGLNLPWLAGVMTKFPSERAGPSLPMGGEY